MNWLTLIRNLSWRERISSYILHYTISALNKIEHPKLTIFKFLKSNRIKENVREKARENLETVERCCRTSKPRSPSTECEKKAKARMKRAAVSISSEEDQSIRDIQIWRMMFKIRGNMGTSWRGKRFL